MRVTARYGLHANLPALEAVLHDARQSGVDQIVVGGDVVLGPMPPETLEWLLRLNLPVHFMHGNGERAVLTQAEAEMLELFTQWELKRACPGLMRVPRAFTAALCQALVGAFN